MTKTQENPQAVILEDVLVYDIETLRGPKEGGGWNNPFGMGFGSAVVYSYKDDQYHFFCCDTEGPGIKECIDILSRKNAVVVGFNSIRFDNKVLLGNDYQEKEGLWKDYDILVEVIRSKFNVNSVKEAEEKVGKFNVHNGTLNLDAISKGTFGVSKTGHGAHAPVLLKEKRYQELFGYNLHDVRLTKMHLEHIHYNSGILDGNKNTIKLILPNDLQEYLYRCNTRYVKYKIDVKTGHECEKSGIYRGNCNCRKQIALSKDETFPPCSGCRKGISWKLLKAT